MKRGLPSVVRKRRISLNRGAFLSISKVLYDTSSDWINLDVYQWLFSFKNLKYENSFCPYTKYWGVGRWAGFDHFCFKIDYHSIQPSICTIYHPSWSHSEQLHTALRVIFDLHFKFNPRIKSLVTRALPRINILEGTFWYQLGSAKGDHTYHVFVPYPNPFHACSSHLDTQT